eukprot:TRINITY_DN11158_c0_g1_i1.p2 TRINITY_DN11158_c0_g1~~TRINITY_DN11158_c0_g1_i1.p2  ORF type:complete len:266 (+),score=37.55 TRINITY_DN11158_c0_g1_i1:853-1650(+)
MWTKLFVVAWKMNWSLKKICLAFFFTNLATAPMSFFSTDFMGTVVYHGVANAPHGTPAKTAYDKGVRLGSLATAINSGVSVIWAFMLPSFVNSSIVGSKPTWFVSQLLCAICLCLPLIPQTNIPWVVVTWMSALGIVQTTLNSIPYAMLGDEVTDLYEDGVGQDMGLYMGVINTVQTVAQLIVNFAVGALIEKVKTDVAGMEFGAVCAFIGLIFIVILSVPQQEKIRRGLAPEKEALLQKDYNNVQGDKEGEVVVSVDFSPVRKI